ncbi:MAG: AAA family ATPase [Caldilineaceae bacterium]|nr:AAA family ATPase [Caldilineaceae bacterium]
MTTNRLTRVVVVGTSGSGKTTLARNIAHMLDMPHIELDAIHWGPNWTPLETPILQQLVAERVSAERWALDGNYRHLRDIVWRRATTLIWLDYPFWLVMWRIVSRTFLRALGHQELWNGNRESIRQGFFSRNSVILWSFNTYHRRRKEYPVLLQQPEYAHLNVIIHHSPAETKRWLSTLKSQSK